MFIKPSVLILAVAVCAATPALAQDALKSAPADAFAAIHVDVKALTASQLFKDVAGPLMASPDYQEGLKEMQDKAGFDPMRDLTALTVFLSPGKNGEPAPTIVARGKFNPSKIKASAAKEGEMKVKSAGGVEYLLNPADGMGLAVTDGVAVIGQEVNLAKALKGGGSNAALGKLAKQVATNEMVWFTVTVPADMRKAMGDDPMTKEVQSARGSLNLASGLALKLAMGLATEKGAKTMADMLQTQVKAMAGQPELAAMGLAGLVGKIKVAQAATDVKVDLALNDQDLTMLKAFIGMMMMGMGAGQAPDQAPAAPAPQAPPGK